MAEPPPATDLAPMAEPSRLAEPSPVAVLPPTTEPPLPLQPGLAGRGPWSDRLHAWGSTAAIPFGLTLLLGLAGITRQAWRDEHATWWAATIPFDDFIKLLSHVDIVLAPYYLFMRFWIAIAGDSVVAMRLPSLIAMAAAAALTARIGAKLFSPNVGLTAGCLLAVIPSVSRYAEEARPYAFAMCFATASVLALLAALGPSGAAGVRSEVPFGPAEQSREPGALPRFAQLGSRASAARFGLAGRRHWSWMLLGLLVLLTGLSHLVALLTLLVHVPLARSAQVAGMPFGRSWKPWSISVGLALLPLIPLAWLGGQQTAQVSWIDASLRSLVTLPQSLTRSATTAGILAALALLAVVGTAWSREIVILLVWAFGPPLVLFLVANDLFYYRYLLFTLPAWTLLAASVIRLVAIPRQKLAAAALCLAVLALGIRDHIGLRKSPLPGDQDYQAAAAYIRERATPADQVVFDGFSDQRERLGLAYEWRGVFSPPICTALETCAAQRIWLVRNGLSTPPPGFTPTITQPFPGLAIILLTRP